MLSAFLGHGLEAAAITLIVLFAVLLGFVQEYRAERAIEALREMAAPTATVVRDGNESEIPARDLVPGDLIVLTTGDKVPADARLFQAINLMVEEASLTGESIPVSKLTAALIDQELTISDRKNLAFAGTVVTYGRGRAVVVATGSNTEFGKIASMLEAVETGKTPLQQPGQAGPLVSPNCTGSSGHHRSPWTLPRPTLHRDVYFRRCACRRRCP